MANENKMQYVILGLLCHEPMSGYELKKRMDTTMSLFWSGSFGSIYPTLQKLNLQGYIKHDDAKEQGRGKIVYEITDKGKDLFRQWMRKPVVKDEIQYETLLKVFFGNEIGSEEILCHIDAFEAKVRHILPKVERSVELLKGLTEKPEHEYYMLTAMFGVKIYQASLEWCEEVRRHFGR